MELRAGVLYSRRGEGVEAQRHVGLESGFVGRKGCPIHLQQT